MADPYESYIQALLNSQNQQASQIAGAYGNVQGAPISPKPNLAGQLAPVENLATASPYGVEQQAAQGAFNAIGSGGGGVLSALQGLAGAQNQALQTQAQLTGQDLLTSLYNSTNESLMRAALEQQQWQAQQEAQQSDQRESILQTAIQMATSGVDPSAIRAYVGAIDPSAVSYLDQLFPQGTNPWAPGAGHIEFAPGEGEAITQAITQMVQGGTMNNTQIRSILAAQYPQYAGNPEFEQLINSVIEQNAPGTFARFGGVEPPGQVMWNGHYIPTQQAIPTAPLNMGPQPGVGTTGQGVPTGGYWNQHPFQAK